MPLLTGRPEIVLLGPIFCAAVGFGIYTGCVVHTAEPALIKRLCQIGVEGVLPHISVQRNRAEEQPGSLLARAGSLRVSGKPIPTRVALSPKAHCCTGNTHLPSPLAVSILSWLRLDRCP